MKTSHFIFLAIFSALSFKVISPTQVLLPKKVSSRMPASSNESEKIEVTCKAEQKGEKLESEIKQLIEDKENILKEVQGLKKERASLKKPANEEVIGLMSEMTTLFTTQMQQQMQQQMQMQIQMQAQMMSMFSKIQTTLAPDVSALASAQMPLQDVLNFSKMFVGIPQHSPWSNYQNPFMMMPEMTRTPINQNPSSDFTFIQRPQPAFTGFNFSQPSQSPSIALPELERQQLSFSIPLIRT